MWSSRWRRGEQVPWGFYHKGTNPIYEDSTLIPNPSQRPHFLIPSDWGVVFQHTDVEGDTNIQTVAITVCSPRLRSGELCPTFLNMEYLHKLFGFFLCGKIYLFIQTFILSVWIHGFYTLGCSPVQLYFLALIVPILASKSSFRWFLCLFLTSCHHFFFFKYLFTSRYNKIQVHCVYVLP